MKVKVKRTCGHVETWDVPIMAKTVFSLIDGAKRHVCVDCQWKNRKQPTLFDVKNA